LRDSARSQTPALGALGRCADCMEVCPLHSGGRDTPDGCQEARVPARSVTAPCMALDTAHPGLSLLSGLENGFPFLQVFTEGCDYVRKLV
jgi:hypothetical protein